MSHALAPYRSLERLLDDAAELCLASGGEVLQYGESEEGRPLFAYQLPGDDDRNVMMSANLHGPEYISAEIALGLLSRGAQGDLAALRKKASLFVLPCLNPDGYQKTWDENGQGDLAALRTNAHGVDLNRNFPLPPGVFTSRLPGQGSNQKGDATYRGQGPLSEAESRHLSAFLDENAMWASINGHSFMGTCLPPRVTEKSDVLVYKELCRAVALGQKKSKYWRLSSTLFDGFSGELEDYQHHHYATWAITLESFPIGKSIAQHLRAPSLFWRFNPKDPSFWVDNDLPGVLAFFDAALLQDAPTDLRG
ncbi:MAG: hypothetical protein GY822_07745 [Deltaproteobacteria bacterium]|nr:hypothetical protein [Deltaproteobacteria bacterium]